MAIDPATGLHHPEWDEIELQAVLHAHDPPLEIVRRLSEVRARACGALGSDPPSRPSASFRVLRESGVIAQTREGTTKLTSLRRDDLDARFPGLLDAVLASQTVAA